VARNGTVHARGRVGCATALHLSVTRGFVQYIDKNNINVIVF